MPRQSDDTWDLASGVGITATGCAATRALAAQHYPQLIRDPYAEALVEAVGIDAYVKMARGQPDPEMARAADESTIAYTVARTKFFDDFLLEAANDHDIRQIVVLASGLDTRSHRLAWPPTTVIYDVDQPDVVTFKSRTLRRIGATTTALTKSVGADLRRDWSVALMHAGFSALRPTAWIAEGLFGYLPPDAQNRLLDQVSALSAANSRIAIEYLDAPDLLEAMNADPMRNAVGGAFGGSEAATNLVYGGPRHDTAEYLSGLHWTTWSVSTADLRQEYALPPVPDSTLLTSQFAYVSASLNRRKR